MLEIIEAAPHVFSDGSAGFGSAEHIRQRSYGREDVRNRVRIGGVGRDSQFFERMNRIEAVERFSDEDKIRVEGSNYFHAWVDAASYFRLFLRICGIVALIGVAYEAILETEGVEGFGQVGREGNDAANRLRDAHAAASFIDNFTESGGLGGRVVCTLRVRRRCGARENGQQREDFGTKARRQQLFQNPPTIPASSSPNKKAPRDAQGLPASPFLAKS